MENIPQNLFEIMENIGKIVEFCYCQKMGTLDSPMPFHCPYYQGMMRSESLVIFCGRSKAGI